MNFEFQFAIERKGHRKKWRVKRNFHKKATKVTKELQRQ